jgi:hypothetical protein
MPDAIGHQLLDEDRSLIEAHQLGTPLRIYKIKRVMLRLMGGAAICSLILGAVILLDLIAATWLGWHKSQIDDKLLGALLIGLACFCLLAGLFLLGIEIPGIRKQQIIVCEKGLLQTSMKFGRKRTDTIYWENIRAIRKFPGSFSYTVIGPGDEVFLVDGMYQQVKELVALIETRKGKR